MNQHMKHLNPLQRHSSDCQQLRSSLSRQIRERVGVSYGGLLCQGLLLAVLCLMTSCRTPPLASDAATGGVPPEFDLKSSTTLKEGDVVTITFETITNLSTTQKITMDGTIPLSMIGNVKASGKTPSELAAHIESLYEPKLQSKETVLVGLQTSTAVVYVTGAVVRPSKVPLERPLTALEAIIEAGGPQPSRAKLAEVVVLRLENGRRIRYTLNIKRELEGNLPSLFYLEPFDVIYVPARAFNF
jgi:polysaccharide biosynthesis/export protein